MLPTMQHLALVALALPTSVTALNSASRAAPALARGGLWTRPVVGMPVAPVAAAYDGYADDDGSDPWAGQDDDAWLADMDSKWGLDGPAAAKVPTPVKQKPAEPEVVAPVFDLDTPEGKIAAIVAELPLLGQQGKYHKAVRRYKTLRKLGGVADGPAYTGVLQACAVGKIPQLAEKVVADMLQFPPASGLQMTDFDLAMRACASSTRPEEALQILKAMRTAGFPPLLSHYVNGLQACVKGPSSVVNEASARELMLQMRTAGVEPDYEAFGVLLSVFTRARRNEEALQAFNYMCKLGPATIEHYGLAMKAAGRAKNVNVIKALMSTAMAEPTIADQADGMIALATKSVADAGEWELACKLLQRHALPRPLSLYHATIASCSRAKQLQVALALFDRMIEDGHDPRRATFNALLHCAQTVGDSATAKRVLGMMTESGLRLNTVTYNIAMNARAQVGDVYGAIKLMEEMQKVGVRPSVVSYATAVNAAARANNSDVACALLLGMQDAGVTPNEYVFTAAIAACENDKDDSTAAASAQKILDVMAQVGMKEELDELKQRVVKQVTRQLHRDPSQMNNDQLKKDEEKLGMRLYGRQTAV